MHTIKLAIAIIARVDYSCYGMRDDLKMTIQSRSRRWIVPVYLGLLVLVIPWYWPAGDMRHAYGLPFWVIATLIALLLTAAFTAWVFLSWPEDNGDG